MGMTLTEAVGAYRLQLKGPTAIPNPFLGPYSATLRLPVGTFRV